MLSKQYLKSSLLLGLLVTALTSHAALFDDTEARKKILDVEKQTLEADAAQSAAIKSIEKRLAAIEAVVNGQALFDMQSQIEDLKQEVAQLKGDLELANHNIEGAQQRQKDLYTDTDARLRKIEEVATPTAPASNSVAAPVQADAKAFLEAEALSQASNYKEAFTAYDAFLKAYPDSSLVPDALYGMGYAQFALKNYKSSIATQQKLVDAYPKSVKVPDAMYNMANSQIQLGQVSAAKVTLSSLIKRYPDAEVIPNAQKRLKALAAFK